MISGDAEQASIPPPASADEKVEKLCDCQKQPADLVTGDDLKRIKSLNLFDACTVQLGDISFYTPSASDTLLNKKTWRRESNIRILDAHVDAAVSGRGSSFKVDEIEEESETENDDAGAAMGNESSQENETNDSNNKVEAKKETDKVNLG
jgi:ubiquitin-conjugating enzyme E2 O